VSIRVTSGARRSRCPLCGLYSSRAHSRYSCTVSDLPSRHGISVELEVGARRFFCDEPSCGRRIFCERLPEAAAHARKTGRLDGALLLVAFELGGRAGSRLAAELGLPASRDSLLRRLRRSPAPFPGEVRVLGVDDWAARKGERYGAILVDLERRRVVDLLPDRSAATLSDLMRVRGRGVEAVSRDRFRPYIEGIGTGAPGATQVADRFHLFKNLYDALEKAVERNRRAAAKKAAPAPSAPPAAPGAGHPLWGHGADPAKREERLSRYERAVELRRRGAYVEDIASEVGLSQRTVVAWLNAGGLPERGRPRRKKPSPVAPYADYLYRRWQERCINMAQLYREIRAMGYEGSYDAVADHVRCLRKGLVPPAEPAAGCGGGGGRKRGTRHESQETARLLMLEARVPASLEPGQRRYLKQLRASCPELVAAQELAGRFAGLVREGDEGGLAGWLREAAECRVPEIAAFAKGVLQDEEAVRAAMREPWSNGQVEGQVNRLKTLKRQMYGRANLDLLKRRVLGAA
jgi:transposase